MKRFFAIALCALFVLASVGCSIVDNALNAIKTPEPSEPTVNEVDPSVLAKYIGDWYGIYAVADAGGVYADNANVSNDCAMRIAVDEAGAYSAYLVINGNGGRLYNCNIADGSTFMLEAAADGKAGLGGGTFTAIGDKLIYTEVYVSGDDYMNITITMKRPGAAWSGTVPVSYDYVCENGFGSLVANMGGNIDDLPQIPQSVSELIGGEVNMMLSTQGGGNTPDVVRTVSSNGQISVILPEGYTVSEDDEISFVISGEDYGVAEISFSVSAWNTDGLTFLIENNDGVTDLYHYTIDGFDCYGAFFDCLDEYGYTLFELCGTDDNGNLIVINIELTMDIVMAYQYVIENSDFTELVLGAQFIVD